MDDQYIYSWILAVHRWMALIFQNFTTIGWGLYLIWCRIKVSISDSFLVLLGIICSINFIPYTEGLKDIIYIYIYIKWHLFLSFKTVWVLCYLVVLLVILRKNTTKSCTKLQLVNHFCQNYILNTSINTILLPLKNINSGSFRKIFV